MSDCLFCRIAAGEEPAKIIESDELSVTFADKFPQAPTHLLVIPRKHLARLSAARTEDVPLLGHLQARVASAARLAGLTDFRLVTNNGREAHQTVDHLHYHVLGGRKMGWPPG